jgi:hypothetical protein
MALFCGGKKSQAMTWNIQCPPPLEDSETIDISGIGPGLEEVAPEP